MLWIALLTTSVCFAQNDVYLNINHLMNGQQLSNTSVGTNNLDESFSCTRMEYYLSQISIWHDGGQQTTVEDTWFLIDAFEESSLYLGNFDIQNVDSIVFGVGVEEAANHLDPALYEESHPLAYQNPSMHWGWTSGYRFVAFEGTMAASDAYIWQVHALGDNNYELTQVSVEAEAADGTLEIELNGNYDRAFENVQLGTGIIVHGTSGKAIAVMTNMQTNVFVSAEEDILNSIEEEELLSNFQIFPQPASVNEAFTIVNNNAINEKLIVYNLHGAEIFSSDLNAFGETNFQLSSSGIYLVHFVESDIFKKLIIR